MAKLRDPQIRAARPGPAAYKLVDEAGLFLLVTPAGGRLWRFRYRRPVTRKENVLSLGAYPAIDLATAREHRDAARKLLAHGVDPAKHREAEKAAAKDRATNSFEVVAREWFGKQKDGWARAHADRIIRRLERDVFPHIGGDPIAAITAPKLLSVMRRIESRGRLETAHRALSNCGQVFRYAVASGYAERDPSGDLRGAMPSPKGKHFAAVVDPAQLGELLKAIDSYQKGTPIVHSALRLAPLVFVRPGELRHAKWADIDLEAAEWRFKLSKKADTGHIVPLSEQAIEILKDLKPVTGNGPYVFPSVRTKLRPMSDNTINAALRSLGIAKDVASAHGFRATARTLLDEVLKVRVDLIEHQLGHAVRDPNGRAYNRTSFIVERRKMMQDWAAYLDALRADSKKVVPLRPGSVA